MKLPHQCVNSPDYGSGGTPPGWQLAGTLTSLDPQPFPRNRSAPVDLNAHGSGFTADSQLKVGPIVYETVFHDPTWITATVGPIDSVSNGDVARVMDPVAKKFSPPYMFSLAPPPAPVITSMVPNTCTLAEIDPTYGMPGTIYGTSLTSCQVQTRHPTNGQTGGGGVQVVDDTQINVNSLPLKPYEVGVYMVFASRGGQKSNEMPFTVTA